VRILLVEDHPLMVAGLRTCIGADHDIVHAIADGNEVLPWLRLNQVDLVTLDLSLPNRSGHELIDGIAVLSNPPRVLVVTMHDAASIAKWMRDLGAHGFIAKDAPMELFRRVLAEVAAGGTWFPEPAEEDPAGRRSSRWTPSLRLTRREYDVLTALRDDLSRKATAARLRMSVYTVDDHLAAIRRVFKVATNPAAIGAAIEAGIIPQLSIPRNTSTPWLPAP
jgi:DNA-binding NarL/FixJ family response regulator